MRIHNPPANDAERLANLLEAFAALDDADDPNDDEIRAEAEADGIDFEAWGAEIKAKAEACLEAERLARRAALSQVREEEVLRVLPRPSGPRSTRTVCQVAGGPTGGRSPVELASVVRDGPPSANDVVTLEQQARAERSLRRLGLVRHAKRALVVGLAAACAVGLAAFALRWATPRCVPLARKLSQEVATYVRSLEGAAATGAARPPP
jgi:hypothetical protein